MLEAEGSSPPTGIKKLSLGQEGGWAVSRHRFLPVPSVTGSPVETPWAAPGFLRPEHPCSTKCSRGQKNPKNPKQQRDTVAEEVLFPGS